MTQISRLVGSARLKPHPHWTRHEKRSKSGHADPVVATVQYTLHPKQCATQRHATNGTRPISSRRAWRVASSVDEALKTGRTYLPSSSSTWTVSRASSSISSLCFIPSGISLGIAATHVRNRSIFGFRSPLQNRQEFLYLNLGKAVSNGGREKTPQILQKRRRKLPRTRRTCTFSASQKVENLPKSYPCIRETPTFKVVFRYQVYRICGQLQ